MATSLSRRALLRGQIAGNKPVIRPPWALSEAQFVDSCSRCGDCSRACGENIIRTGDGGFPAIDFQYGECTFCGDCVSACDSGALSPLARDTSGEPWQLSLAVGSNCLAHNRVICRSCVEQCETRAITFPPRIGGIATPHIVADACNGCGACIASCPVAALSLKPQTRSSSGTTGKSIQEMHR